MRALICTLAWSSVLLFSGNALSRGLFEMEQTENVKQSSESEQAKNFNGSAKDQIPDDFLGLSDLRAKLNSDIANLDNEIREIAEGRLPRAESLKTRIEGLDKRISELSNKSSTNEKEQEELRETKSELTFTMTLRDRDPDQLRDQLTQDKVMLRDKRALATEVQKKLAAMLSPQQAFKRTMSMTFAILIALVICGFFLIANRDEQIRKAIFSGEAGIQFITLFSLVVAIILFGITGILEGKELAALLGGLSGYILGRSTPKA